MRVSVYPLKVKGSSVTFKCRGALMICTDYVSVHCTLVCNARNSIKLMDETN